ncbi:MAG TPA: hypothetical protein VF020_18885, partial [Chthoniobacterales bacterium]
MAQPPLPSSSQNRVQPGGEIRQDQWGKWAYKVVHGNLLIRNPQTRRVEQSGITNAELVRQSGDGMAYVLLTDGRLIQIPRGQASGIVTNSELKVLLPLRESEAVADFAVSGGDPPFIVYTLQDRRPGQFAYIDASRMKEFEIRGDDDLRITARSNALEPDWISVPQIGGEAINRLIVESDGTVYLEGSNNNFFRGRRTDGADWDFDAVIAGGRRRAQKQGPLDRLIEGWIDVSDELPAYYNRFTGGANDPKVEFFGGSTGSRHPSTRAEGWRKRVNAVYNTFAHLTFPILRLQFLRHDFDGQDLLNRWGDYWKTHKSLLVTAHPLTRRDVQDVRGENIQLGAADRANWQRIDPYLPIDGSVFAPLALPDGTDPSQSPAWIQLVTRRSMEAVRDLEREWLNRRRLIRRPGSRSSAGSSSGQQNTFERLYQWRVQFAGAQPGREDPVAHELRRLLDRGAYIAIGPNPRKRQRAFARIIARLNTCHEALAFGIGYADAGFPPEALLGWARSVIYEGSSPKTEPMLSRDQVRQAIVSLLARAAAPVLDRLAAELRGIETVRPAADQTGRPVIEIGELIKQRVDCLGQDLALRDPVTNTLLRLVGEPGALRPAESDSEYIRLRNELAGHNTLLKLAFEAADNAISPDAIFAWVQSQVARSLAVPAIRPSNEPVWPQRIREQLLPKVDNYSLSAVKELERLLGVTNLNGSRNLAYLTERQYQQVTARPDLVWSPQNTLFRLWSARTRCLGGAAATDEVTRRLEDLLNRNIYLPRERQLIRGRAEGRKLPAHRATKHTLPQEQPKRGLVRPPPLTPYTVPVSALLSVTATLQQAVRDGQAGVLSNDRLNEIVASVDDRKSVLLHKAYFTDTRQFGAFSRTLLRFNKGLADQYSQLMRALRARHPEFDVADQFTRMVLGGLTPGKKIRLRIYSGGGFDLDGLSFNFSGLYPSVFGPWSFNLQPTQVIAATRDSFIEFGMSEDGKRLTIGLGRVVEKDLGFWGLKITLGRGRALGQKIFGAKSTKKPVSTPQENELQWWDFGLPFAFSGSANPLSILARAAHIEHQDGFDRITRDEITVTLEKVFDDKGSVRSFLYRFFTGNLSAWEVLKEAEAVSVDTGKAKTNKFTFSLQLLVVTGLTWYSNLSSTLRLKLLKGLVPRALYIRTGTKGSSTTIGKSGIQRRVIQRRTSGLIGDLIRVNEFQGLNAGWVIGQPKHGSEVPGPRGQPIAPGIGNLEIQNKWPEISLLQRVLLARRLENHGYTVSFDKKNKLEWVRAELRTSSRQLPDWAHQWRALNEVSQHFNEKSYPQLAELKVTIPALIPYIESLKKTAQPVSVVLELKPEALQIIQRCIDYVDGKDVDIAEMIAHAVRTETRRQLRTNQRLEKLIESGSRSWEIVDIVTRALLDTPENLRIARITVTTTHAHNEGLSKGWLGFRRQTGAENIL